MNFLADECCDAPIVAGLRDDGHDVLWASEAYRGAEDTLVLAEAVAQGRILITEDKDFGELVVRLGLPAHGIVLLRMDPADCSAKLDRLREVMAGHAGRLADSFTVIEATRVRFRPLRPVP